MRNVFLIIRREYLERVRAKSFVLSTIVLPVFMALLMILPAKLESMKTKATHHIVVAASPQVAALIKEQLEGAGPERQATAGNSVAFKVQTSYAGSEASRQDLTSRLERGEFEAFIWAPDDALASGKVSISGRDLSDFTQINAIKSVLTKVRQQHVLAAYGIKPGDITSALKSVDLETIRIERGKATKTNTQTAIMVCVVMTMLLYIVLLLYGVMVTRAVLEEKTSRVMEVLLSSVTPRELMAGKILGLGAVGFTQVLIWTVFMLLAALPGVAGSGLLQNAHITVAAVLAFASYFVLGFLLYSTVFAAMGAMVSSEQEGHQLQFFGMLPLILSVILMAFVIRQPNAPISVWASLVPFCSPILMYIRIAVQPPPVWQIATSIVLMLVTIWGMMELCGRIYRVGVLMYGKRPTLPELMKWLKYAKS
jgi:ABC-2 type transport system permease protein